MRESILFNDYPNLIRLNPSVPWKTRGNGAIVLRLLVDENKVDKIIEIIYSKSIEYTEISGKFRHTQPGLAVYVGEITDYHRKLYRKALTDIVVPDVALKIADKTNTIILLDKNNRGNIGAISAIGALTTLDEDYTFELLAYRSPEYWGQRTRNLNPDSVKKVELKYRDYLFSNYDFDEERVLVTPHGPDPVLLGLRGEDPLILVKAFKELEIYEPVLGWIIYRTNQATDAHLIRRDITSLRPYQTGYIEGKIITKPQPIKGGHVRIIVSDGKGSIEAYFYEPSKTLKKIALKLLPGDKVRLGGSVRPPSSSHPSITFNVEKLEIMYLVKYIERNPRCPKCGKTMKSAGRGKGFKCPRCGYRSTTLSKIKVPLKREINAGVYTPPLSSIHHLSKPKIRYGRENKGKLYTLINQWYSFNELTGE